MCLLKHLHAVSRSGSLFSASYGRTSLSEDMRERSPQAAWRPGDPVIILPSGLRTRVARIVTFDGEWDEAHAGQSVTLTLEDEVDAGRGDTIAAAGDAPETATALEATLVWLNEKPAELRKRYRIKHNTRQDWAELKQIDYRININTLDHEAASSLEMNAIGVVEVETSRPLAFDPYVSNRATGSFILIDPVTNATVAAGMICRAIERSHHAPVLGAEVTWRTGDGALVFSAPGETFAADSDDSGARHLDDPEAAELLARLLGRLKISLSKE